MEKPSLMQLLFGTNSPNVYRELLEQKEKELQQAEQKIKQLQNSKSFFRRIRFLPFLYYKTSDTCSSIPGNETENAI